MNDRQPLIEEQSDRVAIIELVQRERVARDMQRWDALRASYNADYEVEISWFKGTGADFANASQRMMAGALRSFHQMGPTIVTIKGDRALSETGCAIHLIGKLRGVEVDVTGHGRLYSRVERQSAAWLLSSFRVAYIQDAMVPLDPTRPPQFEAALLAGYRSSYRFICLMLAENGLATRDDLPGMDKPETVQALLDADEAWLNEAQ